MSRPFKDLLAALDAALSSHDQTAWWAAWAAADQSRRRRMQAEALAGKAGAMLGGTGSIQAVGR